MKRVSKALPAIVLASTAIFLAGCENGATTNSSTVQPTKTSEATPATTSENTSASQLASAMTSGDQKAPEPSTPATPRTRTRQPDASAVKGEPPRIKTTDPRMVERQMLIDSADITQAAPADGVREKMPDTRTTDRTPKTPKTDSSQFVNADAPVVVVAEPTSVDLGELATSEVGVGKVKLINNSDQPMKLVECKSSCGCTTTNCPKDTVIPAKESIELEVRLTASATPNDHLSKTLTYIVEGHPMITIPVHAKVISFVAVEPAILDTDSSLDGKLTLRAIDDQPFVITSVIPAIFDGFSTEPATTQELTIDWNRFVESAHRGRITIYTTHPKSRAAYVNVRGVKATEAQQKWMASRNSSQQTPNLSPTAPGAQATTPSQFDPQVVAMTPLDARLHANAKVDNVEEINKAIAEGANIDATDANGKTALHLAVAGGKYDAAMALLEAGADLEARDRSGRTPLMWSVESRNVKLVLNLIERGASLDARDETGGTPLMWAAGFGDVNTVQAILQAKPDLTATDSHGMTPLMWAASFGDGARAKLLIDAGIGLDVVDASRGCSALMYAARSSGAVETLQVLLDAGADLDLVDVTGRTALSWAALLGTPEKVQLLLDAGSDVTKEDFRGWTPLAYAKNRRDRNGAPITAILEDATAKAKSGDDKSASAAEPVDPQARR